MAVEISVIVPVYNAEKYIERCLNSIMSQTVNNLELICVNDGSTDGSLEKLNEYKKAHGDENDREIVIIDKPNEGPSAARNAGLDAAKGRFVAFVDSDDIIEPQMYETLINIAEENNLNLVLCGVMNCYPDGRKVGTKTDLPLNTLLDRNDILKLICPTFMREGIWGGPCNKIYRRSYIESHHMRMPKSLHYGEDAVFQMQVVDNLERTWFDPSCFYKYIHRPRSQSSAKLGRFKDTLEPLYEIRLKYAEKWGLPKALAANYFVYCTAMDLVNVIKSKNYADKSQYIKSLKASDHLKHALKIADFAPGELTKKLYAVYRVMKMVIR